MEVHASESEEEAEDVEAVLDGCSSGRGSQSASAPGLPHRSEIGRDAAQEATAKQRYKSGFKMYALCRLTRRRIL